MLFAVLEGEVDPKNNMTTVTPLKRVKEKINISNKE